MKQVVSIHDDRPCPLVGRVIGHEDEDRVLVLWGDDAYQDDNSRARVEWADELTGWRN